MRDKFVAKFNLKKVALFSLASVMFTIGGLYFATLPQEELTDTVRLPKGGQIRNKSIIQSLMMLGALFFGACSFAFMFLLIALILNKLIFKNEEKELLVVNSEGILINRWSIFSKPTLVGWEHIKDICVFDPKNYIIKGDYKQLKNKIIAVETTQEFYKNSSFFKRMIYKFNKKLSNGYEININLNFSTCDADEVISEINKYQPTE